MLQAMNFAILIGAGLIAVSALTSLAAQRAGAPLLLVFLAIGLLAGEDGLLGIEFDSGPTAYFIGTLALSIILFDSGFETPTRSFRAAAGPAITLATIGVVLTTSLVGATAHLLLGIGWLKGLLLGSIVASTDAAAVFFLLRVGGITLRDRVKSTLEIESGSNDPMAIFLTALLADLVVAAPDPSADLGWQLAANFSLQMGLGLLAGVIGGLAIAWLLDRLSDLEAGLYPITALAAALMLVAATALVGGSGFLAAYVAGVVAGNRRVRFAARLRRFQIGMTWLAQIGMFLTLGLLATPSEFGFAILPGLGLAAILIFIARPLAVWLCLLPFGFSARETAFVAWVGLRGAVSILLAILPSLAGVPDGGFYFNIVFIMVLTSLLVQGWTIPLTARRLHQIVPLRSSLVNRVELELPGDTELELVGYRIHPDSAIARGERVPRWARPVLIVRNEHAHSIHNAGPLRPQDEAYLFSSPRRVQILDKIYGSPVEPDDPAIFGDFALQAGTTLAELAHHYGAVVESPTPPETTLGSLLMSKFRNQPAVGDRMTLGPVEIVVRALKEDDSVAKVGVVLAPERRRRLRRWWPWRRLQTRLSVLRPRRQPRRS
ncbi:MAG: potassium/proton antiporter [Rhodospirillales bacterium]|nr:potassium/proton antiporter [Rhodospirillales bacterium]